jgi:hypothetical protein
LTAKRASLRRRHSDIRPIKKALAGQSRAGAFFVDGGSATWLQ